MTDVELKVLIGQGRADNLLTRQTTQELQARVDVLVGILSDLRDATVRMTFAIYDLTGEIQLLRSQLTADTAPNGVKQ